MSAMSCSPPVAQLARREAQLFMNRSTLTAYDGPGFNCLPLWRLRLVPMCFTPSPNTTKTGRRLPLASRSKADAGSEASSNLGRYSPASQSYQVSGLFLSQRVYSRDAHLYPRFEDVAPRKRGRVPREGATEGE